MSLKMNPYIVTDGNGKEAIAFYEKALGATVVQVSTFGEMPADPEHPVPAEAKDLVLHASLMVGDTSLMLSDNFPGSPYQKGDNVTIVLQAPTAEAARELFEALAEGGQVTMPLQETFWSPAYGQLTDKFGIPWQINVKH